MKEKSTKEKVLDILMENANTYVSGEKLASKLYVTRAGIWKAVSSLRNEGYSITSVTNRGYMLQIDGDPIRLSFIEKALKVRSGKQEYPAAFSPKIYHFETVGSTNTEAVNRKNERDILIIADEQTNGRGRKGRSFYSPKDTGLYFSLLTHPHLSFDESSYLTCAAAEAVVNAIHDETGLKAGIKWMNDIFLGNKKVAGILTETTGSFEEKYPEFVIVGIGINVYPLPKDNPAKSAGSLMKKGEPVENLRNRLLIRTLVYFDRYFMDLQNGQKSFLEGYRNHSNLIGKYVRINDEQSPRRKNDYALVEGIDDNCRLIVRFDDGREESLKGTEVSVVRY